MRTKGERRTSAAPAAPALAAERDGAGEVRREVAASVELGVRVQEEVEGDGVGPAARGVGREPIQDLVAHGRRTLEDRVDVERAVLAWVGNVGLRDDLSLETL